MDRWIANLKGNRKRRTLDDEELDSGDDENREDRMEEDGAAEMDEVMEEEQFNYMDAELIRHAVPCPSDNEVCNISKSYHANMGQLLTRR